MNDIGTIGQAFINILFTQLHGFGFICLLQPRSLTVVEDRIVTLDPITHFVTTELFLRDKWGKVHIKTLDLFPTKLGQYSIILGLLWFKKHLTHIQFDNNTVTFNFPHCLQYYSPSYQAVTISGFNTSFDHPLCLSTLSDQAVNLSNADDFAPNPPFRSLSYYRCGPCWSPHQAVNISSIDKPNNRCSHSTSSSMSSQM